MSVTKGLNNILGGGTEFITFEEGKAMTLLFIDWYEDLMGIREHYEASLNPKYIRCPGKEVCPLCHANPNKYPSMKVKFRVYDPTDNKVKFVSLAKSHVQKLNTEFNLDQVDPTREYVTIYRTGKGASDTSYSARRAREQYPMPNFEELDMPDIMEQVTPHTPEQIQGFMNALLAGAASPQPAQAQNESVPNDLGYGGSQGVPQYAPPQTQPTMPQGGYQPQTPQQSAPRKLPF